MHMATERVPPCTASMPWHCQGQELVRGAGPVRKESTLGPEEVLHKDSGEEVVRKNFPNKPYHDHQSPGPA